MEIRRRISATFKDLPGGQVLGPTFDYTHRLLDRDRGRRRRPSRRPRAADDGAMPRVTDLLAGDDLIEPLRRGRSGRSRSAI